VLFMRKRLFPYDFTSWIALEHIRTFNISFSR
jgi:hypothetical protein